MRLRLQKNFAASRRAQSRSRPRPVSRLGSARPGRRRRPAGGGARAPTDRARARATGRALLKLFSRARATRRCGAFDCPARTRRRATRLIFPLRSSTRLRSRFRFYLYPQVRMLVRLSFRVFALRFRKRSLISKFLKINVCKIF